jgi:hypothetical protein
MTPTSKKFLDEILMLLARHFGEKDLRAAIDRVSAKLNAEGRMPIRSAATPLPRIVFPPVHIMLESIKEREPEKHRLLIRFFDDLRNRKVLIDSQDIRYFAQMIGIKEIRGKSRKDVIPKLMFFLLDLPTSTLRQTLRNANDISEQQRQKGFSVLADKLLKGK